MHKKSITCATEFKRKFAVQPHLHPYEFCGGLHMSVARSNSICILESNSRDNPPNCSIFQERGETMPSVLFFISDEPRHDAKFVFALLCSLVAQLPKLIHKLEYIHYWTDSSTSHNKTIFKIVSCHCKYLKVPSPS